MRLGVKRVILGRCSIEGVSTSSQCSLDLVRVRAVHMRERWMDVCPELVEGHCSMTGLRHAHKCGVEEVREGVQNLGSNSDVAYDGEGVAV